MDSLHYPLATAVISLGVGVHIILLIITYGYFLPFVKNSYSADKHIS